MVGKIYVEVNDNESATADDNNCLIQGDGQAILEGLARIVYTLKQCNVSEESIMETVKFGLESKVWEGKK